MYRVSQKNAPRLTLGAKTQSINFYYLMKVYHDICSCAKFRMKMLKLVVAILRIKTKILTYSSFAEFITPSAS